MYDGPTAADSLVVVEKSVIKVTVGIKDDISLDVLSTLKCTVIAICLNCSVPTSFNNTEFKCTSYEIFSAPMGYYRINLTIASDCGEIFNLQSTVLFVGKFLNALMRPNLLFIPLYTQMVK